MESQGKGVMITYWLESEKQTFNNQSSLTHQDSHGSNFAYDQLPTIQTN